jgi:hypothetical protein
MPRLLLRAATALVATLAAAGTADAQISQYATQGYLDFLGATSGAPTVTGGIATGPYRATFGPTSATQSPTVFSVYCIDWLGQAGDSKVKVFTFSQALTLMTNVATGLRTKYADDPEGSAGGLTQAKLNSAAWLTKQMTTANKDKWNEMHVALWNIFWDPAIGSPALPGLAFLQDGPGAGMDPNAQYWYNQAMANQGFHATDFRVLAAYKSCKVNNVQTECLDTSKQVFLAQTVPEPGTYALMATGLVALGVAARRRRRS